MTTTRVAERAGVSVGTMYQYFPHKQSLLYALNERYLDRLAERVEMTCFAHQGKTTGEMVEALITAYWEAKTERRRSRVCTQFPAPGFAGTQKLADPGGGIRAHSPRSAC